MLKSTNFYYISVHQLSPNSFRADIYKSGKDDWAFSKTGYYAKGSTDSIAYFKARELCKEVFGYYPEYW